MDDTSIARLHSLIEFVRQAQPQPRKRIMDPVEHGEFMLTEAAARGIPGLTLSEPVWLSLEREPEILPPPLPAGLQGSEDPETPPPEPDDPALQSGHDDYLRRHWQPWAQRALDSRKNQALYRHLFQLQQKLLGQFGSTPLELLWGFGVVCWAHPELGTCRSPLLLQPMALHMDPQTRTLQILPNGLPPRLEIAPYLEAGISGLEALIEAARPFTDGIRLLGPNQRSALDALLRQASELLGSEGHYWPDQAPAQDRRVPAPGPAPVLTDTWVLFARPRRREGLVSDLDALEAALEQASELPPPVQALLSAPPQSAPPLQLPRFQGLSMAPANGSGPVRPLFFPKPFNAEQARIIQLLEACPGAVVQGPPGTGKTHTIANIISHYLASGRRVLVTALKEPPLAVLRSQLPEPLQPLTLSLLPQELDGLQQFEASVEHIATQLATLDPQACRQQVAEQNQVLSRYHQQLEQLDQQLQALAEDYLQPILIDGSSLDPWTAAGELLQGPETTQIPDSLTPADGCRPRFGEEDLDSLRQARRRLGLDIELLRPPLPDPEQIPDTLLVLRLHRQLCRLRQLEQLEAQGKVPGLEDRGPGLYEQLDRLLARCQHLQDSHEHLHHQPPDWQAALEQHLQHGLESELAADLRQLEMAVHTALQVRRTYQDRPLQLPDDLPSDLPLAIQRLIAGQPAWPLSQLRGRRKRQRTLASIRVSEHAPCSPADWQHVLGGLQHRQQVGELLQRWNSLAPQLSMPQLDPGSDSLPVLERMLDRLTALQQHQQQMAAFELQAQALFPDWHGAHNLVPHPQRLTGIRQVLQHHLLQGRLLTARREQQALLERLPADAGPLQGELYDFLHRLVGHPRIEEAGLQEEWEALLQRLSQLRQRREALKPLQRVTALIEVSGAPRWAEQLRTRPCPDSGPDPWLPDDALQQWRLCRLRHPFRHADTQTLADLQQQRRQLEEALAQQYRQAVSQRTWLQLALRAGPEVRAALELYRSAIRRIGKGQGVRAERYREDARQAAHQAARAIPCWIMPQHRIAETLPPVLGDFDLVIIDEASQSDLSALPAILRARKLLIVGDDRQVSPEAIGLNEGHLRTLMHQHLQDQVGLFRPMMSPEHSVYDLFKVVFAQQAIMLREHFRCVPAIIEYARREIYQHALLPLRIPAAASRLDPPLIDLHVTDGRRSGNVNAAEARAIVAEIRRLSERPELQQRSIGVVSLLGHDQARYIMDLLLHELGEPVLIRHQILCGDARTFQGNERDILFLSMVVSPPRIQAQTRDAVLQRFNVAASRARDRMYLVRSFERDDLSATDSPRRSLLQHFIDPFPASASRQQPARPPSPFETRLYQTLLDEGYNVELQAPAGPYPLDLVVEGPGGRRLAIGCDGDRPQTPTQWREEIRQQLVLERVGWPFWRCFAAAYRLDPEHHLHSLKQQLTRLGITPHRAPEPDGPLVEHRRVQIGQSAD